MEVGLYLASRPPEPDNIVFIGLPDEAAIHEIAALLRSAGVHHRVIAEPDMNNEVTAIGTEPVQGETRRIFRQFHIWKPQHVQVVER